MSVFLILSYIIFVIAAIVLIVVILLQEGKGGGFGEALGGHGQATFGVGSSGINRFTGWIAVIFLVTALGIQVINREHTSSSLLDSSPSVIDAAPADGSGSGDN